MRLYVVGRTCNPAGRPLDDFARAATPLPAGGSDIHLWCWRLDVSEDVVESCRRVLSGEEHAKARAFRFDALRLRYTVSRGMLRQILARYLSTAPGDIRFEYGTWGKPNVPAADLSFSLAHSEKIAVCAATSGGHVGVDAESPMRPEFHDWFQVGTTMFNPEESDALRRADEHSGRRSFLALWTLKEAFGKALGTGLREMEQLPSFHEIRYEDASCGGAIVWRGDCWRYMSFQQEDGTRISIVTDTQDERLRSG